MLNMRTERFGFGLDSTLGAWSFANDPFTCYSLEDERRQAKVQGETCIPIGNYEILLKTDSPKFERKYMERFPEMHRGMLWLQDVLGFSWVYIHMGNLEKHTEGCILPNLAAAMLPSGEFRGMQSKTAYEAIYKRVIAAYDSGERAFLEVAERQPAL